MSIMTFENKRVLITGAGAGIGRASAELFASRGAQVLALDRDRVSLEQMVASGKGDIVIRSFDITDRKAIASLSREPAFDIVFNCAGIVEAGTALDTSDQAWARSFDINVTATFDVIRATLPAMLQNGGGSIINMASIVSSVKGAPNRFAYGASKAAVIGLTKSVAADFVKQGIRCNAICPGTVDSPSLQQRLHDTGDYDTALQTFLARQPMGRFAEPGEVAELVAYLGSDQAAFITGQAIAIDGGWST
jgi:2-keto-3-deoxy-L-fuconate dehydrogenase